MDIAAKEIKEFQALYQARFGEQLSKEEAHKRGANLVRLIGWITGQGNVIEKDEHKKDTQTK